MFEKLFGSAPSPLVDQALADVCNMLSQTERMFLAAIPAVFDHASAELNVAREDEGVNANERLVRRQIIEHLSLNPTQDLPTSLVLVSIVTDVERLGDFAKGLLEARDLAHGPLQSEAAGAMRKLAMDIAPQFRLTRTAFQVGSIQQAQEVCRRHVQLKATCQDLVRQLADNEALSVNEAVVLSIVGRILRRVSAHLANVASSVVQPFDNIRHGDEEA